MNTSNILTICTGNICRSPMAEALLRSVLPETHVESAGVAALVGYKADPHAVESMAEIGIDLAAHVARQIDADMVRRSSLVLVATRAHKTEIEELYPWSRGRVFRLGEWEGFDIEDPYRRGSEAFRRVRNVLEICIQSWLPRLAGQRTTHHHPSRGIHV